MSEFPLDSNQPLIRAGAIMFCGSVKVPTVVIGCSRIRSQATHISTGEMKGKCIICGLITQSCLFRKPRDSR